MKYIFCILTLLIVNTSCGSIAQQQYKSHTVAQGETVYSISKKYNLSESEIYKLNPDAKKGVQTGSILILPSGAVAISNSESTPTSFKRHRVKRRETLYSISQLYNVSQDDLKKYNKELYSRQLKKGEKIQIPIFGGASSNTSNTGSTTTTEDPKKATHTVQPKETVYGIARKYGITIPELQALNPGLGESVQIGATLNVPDTSVTETATIDDQNYDFYEVQPKEGFFRLKVKLGLTEEEIVALNPYARDGLKEGMILKVPKAGNTTTNEVTKVDLENAISNRIRRKVAVMLPFQLQKASDSIASNEDLLKNNYTIRVALDFYSGVLMASEFAKDKGISVELDIYDTQGSTSKVSSILSQNNFEDTHAIVGPLLSKNVEQVASQVKSKDVPVFSPLSNKDIRLTSNLFQTLPTDAMLEDKMMNFITENAKGKNVLLITDASRNTQKQRILAALPAAKTVSLRKDSFLYVADIENKLDKVGENWIVLEATNPVLVSNVVALLNGLPSRYKVRLLTLDKNDAYDYHDVSNLHLAKLNFTFPSVNKSYNYKDKTPFLVSYKNKYGVLPNKYAVRGFDIMYDVLLRLASADDVYDASNNEYETEYIENKFMYSKKLFSGYQNNALYILKYTNDLQFEVVK